MAFRGKRSNDTNEAAAAPVRLILANDEPGPTQLLRRLLTRAGYELEVATDQLHLARLMDDHAPQLVVLDLGHGGLGANLKLLDAIRNMPRPLDNTRVVLVAPSPTHAMFAWQSGIDGFLDKPFHEHDLLTCIRDTLAVPEDDRLRHRRRMLEAARATGRPLPT